MWPARAAVDLALLPERVAKRVGLFDSASCLAQRSRAAGRAADMELGAYSRARCTAAPSDAAFAGERGSQVLVSEPYKLIYVPNMKAASQLFSKVMRMRFNATFLGTHLLDEYLASRRSVEPNVTLADYLVFTFVRDPMSMFYSAYGEMDKRIGKSRSRGLHFQQLNRTLTQEPARALQCLDLVRGGQALKKSLTPLHMYSQVWKTQRCFHVQGGPLEGNPQREGLPLDGGAPPDGAKWSNTKRRLLRFDFIGTMENAKKDFRALEDMLGIKKHKRLPIINSPKTPIKEHSKNLKQVEFEALEKQVCKYATADYACFPFKMPVNCLI